MKRTIATALIIISLFLMGSCSNSKNIRHLSIKTESVSSLLMQKRVVLKDGTKKYTEKQITEKNDIDDICKKLNALKLEKIEAQVVGEMDYVIVLSGKSSHKIIIEGDKLYFDLRAYKLVGSSSKNAIKEIYNMIAYEEKESVLTPV